MRHYYPEDNVLVLYAWSARPKIAARRVTTSPHLNTVPIQNSSSAVPASRICGNLYSLIQNPNAFNAFDVRPPGMDLRIDNVHLKTMFPILEYLRHEVGRRA